MSMAQSTREDDDMITGINVTPLVDVALVLLVILMVTATYIAARTIPMDLPKATTGESTAAVLVVNVDKEGNTWLDGKLIDREALRLAVRSARQSSKDARAVIAADGGTAHRSVVATIDLLRQEGVSQFAINVQKGDLGDER
jgi:biopolymer transport protein TolR